MASVIWSSPAYSRLEEIEDFIAQSSPVYARLVVKQILEATKRLELFPFSGRIVPELGDPNMREILYKNYRILYFADTDRVDILTIIHAHQSF